MKGVSQLQFEMKGCNIAKVTSVLRMGALIILVHI
jgi:hypothetical protein